MKLVLRSALVWGFLSVLVGPLSAQTAVVGSPVPGGDEVSSPLPGDQIALRVWNEPTLSGTITVQENGEVVLPRFGAFRVVGRPISLVQDSIRGMYVTYLRNPSVEVTVLRRIRVLGEVENPGIFMADLTMRLPEIIAAAGGITEAGNAENVIIIRDGQEVRYRSRDRDSFLSAALQSGDQVVVGRRSALARNPIGTATTVMTAVLTFVTVLLPAIRSLFE